MPWLEFVAEPLQYFPLELNTPKLLHNCSHNFCLRRNIHNYLSFQSRSVISCSNFIFLYKWKMWYSFLSSCLEFLIFRNIMLLWIIWKSSGCFFKWIEIDLVSVRCIWHWWWCWANILPMRFLNCETLTKQSQRRLGCCWLCSWRHASKAETPLAPALAIIQVSYGGKRTCVLSAIYMFIFIHHLPFIWKS